MLKLAGARLLTEREGLAVRSALVADPVVSCMVAARVESVGLDPWRLGGELWGVGSRLGGLCFSGVNLIPLRGGRAASRAFAERALSQPRHCSSLVGPADQVLEMWQQLETEWGPARDVRPNQPLLAMSAPPSVAPDPLVRQVRLDDLERYLPAAVAMFTEEVGIDPRGEDGGASYRARVAELIVNGRAFARFEGGQVVFKAEVGALSARVGQIQGVWVHPEHRNRGLAAAGTAAVVDRLSGWMGRVASLYVNDYNLPARAVYRKVGFSEVGRFATVLL
ncbi:GNAT family N-acetyltransferase [Actinoalloteichus spitiensis]|uniref:GNAT family N-acetyltransferase n=1 Tax=Actinoalloteichus spitiensis TaxID=252394 RepID=UPI0004747240|nr:GNAT family N-acetyltransferase [Actinoalloteichus spitiensis]